MVGVPNCNLQSGLMAWQLPQGQPLNPGRLASGPNRSAMQAVAGSGSRIRRRFKMSGRGTELSHQKALARGRASTEHPNFWCRHLRACGRRSGRLPACRNSSIGSCGAIARKRFWVSTALVVASRVARRHLGVGHFYARKAFEFHKLIESPSVAAIHYHLGLVGWYLGHLGREGLQSEF